MKRLGAISLTTKILLGTIGGIVFGIIAGPWATHLKFIGDMFLRLIQMSVVVLVMSSIICAIGDGDEKNTRQLGIHTFKWIFCITVISALLGMALAILAQPGSGVVLSQAATENLQTVQSSSISQTLVNFVPSNIISAMAEGNMIQCIVFSLLFGLGVSKYVAKTGKNSLLTWVKDINNVVLNVIKIVMNIAPMGIFCLLADLAGSTGLSIIIPMFKFLGLLLIGDVLQFIIFGPLTAMLCHVNVLKMPKKFLRMSMMALTTTSGAICLPTKMEDSVTKFGVSRRVTEFTGPITMSMNSCGAAQCYVIAAFFMAQVSGIEMSPYQMGMAIILSCLMCMGTISVPGGSVIVYTFLATSLGLSVESVAILVGVDWFAGMFRTLMNVDVDVMVGMLVAEKMNELDHSVYNGEKEVAY